MQCRCFVDFSTPNVSLYHSHTTLNDVEKFSFFERKKKVIKKFQSNIGCVLSRSYALVCLGTCAHPSMPNIACSQTYQLSDIVRFYKMLRCSATHLYSGKNMFCLDWPLFQSTKCMHVRGLLYKKRYFRQKIVFVISDISMLVLNFPISGVSTLYDWVAS